MSDEINECEECSPPKKYVQGWELETSDINPVRYYEREEPEPEERIARWLDFIDR